MSSLERGLSRGAGQDHGAAEAEEREAEQQLGERRRNVAMQRRWVQRKANGGGAAGGRIPQGIGSPLGSDVKRGMERHLGADLSGARIHTGSDSAKAAEGFGARAFTVGTDIHFGAGEFAPGSMEGDRLLAHELTHVVQGQRSGIQRKAKDGGESEGKEGEAEGGGKEAGGGGGGGGGEGGGKEGAEAKGEGAEVSQPGEAAEKEADAAGDHVADKKHGKGKEKEKGKGKGKEAKGEGKEEEGKEGEGEGKEAEGEEGGGHEAKGGEEGGGKAGEKGGEKAAGKGGDKGGEKGGDKGAAPEAKEAAPAVGAKLADGAAGKIFLAPKPGAAAPAAAGGAKPPAPGAPGAKSPEETAAEKTCADAKAAMEGGEATKPGYKDLLKVWTDKVKPVADKFADKNPVVKDTATALQKKQTDHEGLCTQTMNDGAAKITAMPKAPESKQPEWDIWTAQPNQAWMAHYQDNAAVKAFRDAHDKKVKELREEHDKVIKDALGKIKGAPDMPDPKNPKDDPRKIVDAEFEAAKKWMGKQIGDSSAESALQEAYANKLESMSAAKEKAQKEKEEKEKADKEKADKEKGAPGAAPGAKPDAAGAKPDAAGAKPDAAGGKPDAAGGGHEAPKEASAAPPAPAAGGEHKAEGGEHKAEPAAAGGGEHKGEAAAPGAEKKAEGAPGAGKKTEEEELLEKREELKVIIEGLKAQLEAKALKGERKLSRVAAVLGVGAGLANPVLGLIVGGSAALITKWMKGDVKGEIERAEMTLEMVDQITDPHQLEEIIQQYMAWNADLELLRTVVEEALSKEPPPSAKRAPMAQGTPAATPGATPQAGASGAAPAAASNKLGKFGKWAEVAGEVLHMGGEAASVAVEHIHEVLHTSLPGLGLGVQVVKELVAGNELKALEPAIKAKADLDKKLADKAGAAKNPAAGGH